MSVGFSETKPRDFNPMSVSGLTKEARDGVNSALKALTTWRNEIAATNEKNGKRVIEQMAEAASALGWPEQVVEAARIQLQSLADVQMKAMDQMADAWEAQIKIAEPDDLVTKVVRTAFPVRLRFGAGRFKPDRTLGAIRGALATRMGRRHGYLGQAPLIR